MPVPLPLVSSEGAGHDRGVPSAHRPVLMQQATVELYGARHNARPGKVLGTLDARLATRLTQRRRVHKVARSLRQRRTNLPQALENPC